MLSTKQKQLYCDEGYLCLRGAVPCADEMQDFVWKCLNELHGIRRADPTTWNVAAPWIGLAKFKDAKTFSVIGNQSLLTAIDNLLGSQAWKKPRNWGGFLISFPEAAPADWNIPIGHWHVDFHFTYDPRTSFGIRVLTFLSEVRARGGGTLIVPRSHQLVARFVSQLANGDKSLKFSKLRDRFFDSNSWFRRLTQSEEPDGVRIGFFMDAETVVDGVSVRIEQLCGKPGDVVLMHPWLVHAPSRNCGTGPRFMLAKDIHTVA